MGHSTQVLSMSNDRGSECDVVKPDAMFTVVLIYRHMFLLMFGLFTLVLQGTCLHVARYLLTMYHSVLMNQFHLDMELCDALDRNWPCCCEYIV